MFSHFTQVDDTPNSLREHVLICLTQHSLTFDAYMPLLHFPTRGYEFTLSLTWLKNLSPPIV
jgi:hypothetical protein